MGFGSWNQIARDAGLPDDADPLVIKNDYAVARSLSKRLVFRIGLRGVRSFDLNPSDIAYAHKIGFDMAKHGLNVLAPLAPELSAHGPYLVSASPLAIPLLEAPWTPGEAVDLGRELRGWADYCCSELPRLDIPSYVRIRAQDAVDTGGTVAAAGEWCLAALEALDAHAPFAQLEKDRPGTIHGDVHPGNLVRHDGRILLIDLDSVKNGPAQFDIAVGAMYQRRYNRNYPGMLIAAGYFNTEDPSVDEELIALQKWKELSSYSQLLLRWNSGPNIPIEFWKRTRSGWEDLWTNVVQTPVVGASL